MRSRGRRGRPDAERGGTPPACRRTARRSRGPASSSSRVDKAGGHRQSASSAASREDRSNDARPRCCSAGTAAAIPRRSRNSSWRPRRCGPRLPEFDFATGYLEFARPTIRDGLAALAARGARRILAIPGMLFAASHVKNDLPWEMNSFIAENPGIDVRLGRDLGDRPEAAGGGGRPYRGGGRHREYLAPRPCSSSSAAAPTTPTPIPTSPSSRACCGRAWVSAGPRWRSAASPIRGSTPR